MIHIALAIYLSFLLLYIKAYFKTPVPIAEPGFEEVLKSINHRNYLD